MTNQWTEEYGVDGGPAYDHCIRCGRPHLLFHGADYCSQCRAERQVHAKRVKDRGECRGGCGCTVQWSVLRCGACRAAGRWADRPAEGTRTDSSAINWEKFERSRGKAKAKDEARVAAYLQATKGHDGNA